MKILAILNPVGRRIRETERRLSSSSGVKVYISEKEGENSIYQLVRRFAEDYDAVLIVGGDGSINKVAKGLIFTGMNKPLLVIPVGSSNDIAHNLGLPKDIDQCLALLEAGKTKEVDIGLVEGEGIREVFVNIFAVGFIGEMAKSAERIKTNRSYVSGGVAYTLAFFRELLAKELSWPIKVSFLTDDREYLVMEDNFLAVCVMNGKRAGHVFNIAPEAKMNDGFFDLFLTENPGRWRSLLQLMKIMKGKHKELKEVKKLEGELPRIKRMDVVSTVPFSAQTDGEPIGTTKSLNIRIKERRIKIFVP